MFDDFSYRQVVDDVRLLPTETKLQTLVSMKPKLMLCVH